MTGVSITPEPAADGDEAAPPTFRLEVVENGEPVESFPGLTLKPGDRNLDKVVNKESKKIKVATKVDAAKLADDLASLPAGTFAVGWLIWTEVLISGWTKRRAPLMKPE